MNKRALRIEYGNYLAELGRKYNNLIVLDADLKDATQSIKFQESHPERFFDAGVAEQNMMCVAAGLALGGKIPVTHSFACFTSMRACEQIRTSIAYPRLNVKFVATHGGLTAGTAGTTHHAIEDIAIMRSMPNMTVLVPGDTEEMRQVMDTALEFNGPVYIRIESKDVEDVYRNGDRFRIAKATELRAGSDACIISTGTMVSEAIQSAKKLEKEGLNVRVLQMASIKPIDTEAILKAAEEAKFLITLEEHNILGGLGGAVSEIVAEEGNAKVKRLGIKDHFCDVGSNSCLLEEEGLSVENISKSIIDFIDVKGVKI